MTIADVVSAVSRGPIPLRVEAPDGSSVGESDAGLTLRLRTDLALRYLITAPGDLGLARGYVSGDIELVGAHPGDPYVALDALARWQFRRPGPTESYGLVRQLGVRQLLPPKPPAQEAPSRTRRTLSGLRHSRRRDSDAIGMHYDVSNAFYEHVLGRSMAYTCALFESTDTGLDDAQDAKFDLVARKLGLQPGMRLLDVGCGWGGMARHAAAHYGAEVVAITLSRQQALWAQAETERVGLAGKVTIIHGDYRDSPGTGYDAISSIGLLEHVGVAHYGSYFALLRSKLRAGGRLLNHCITRPDNRTSPMPGAFIDRYVFPDGELTGAGRIISAAQDAGFEVVHEENLRPHYALTLRHWSANLVADWDACVREVGLPRARVWGLYMAGSRLGFEKNVVQLHQVLAVNTDHDGTTTFSLRPTW